jgi:V/A-type H+-transporting ATPase subunit K
MSCLSFAELQLAFSARSLAVGLACSGSAKGVGTVGRAGAGVLSVDPGNFPECSYCRSCRDKGLYASWSGFWPS